MLKIWDLSTRIYHWVQAVLFFGLVGSAYGVLPAGIHDRLGLLLLILLVWRVGWGLFGSETSRFRQFVKSPWYVVNYLRGVEEPGVGHNPLGALMVVALIAALVLQAGLGLFLTDFVDAKVLLGRSMMRLIEEAHVVNALLLIALVVVHIAVILLHLLRGHNLIKPMITGRTELTAVSPEVPKMISNSRALLWLVSSMMLVFTVIKLII